MVDDHRGFVRRMFQRFGGGGKRGVMIPHHQMRAGHGDAALRCDPFEPGCDIHPIAQPVISVQHDIAAVDPDAVSQRLDVFGDISVSQLALERQGAAQCRDSRQKFRKESASPMVLNI